MRSKTRDVKIVSVAAKHPAVAARLRELLEHAPRGAQKALASAVGKTEATVSRWADGTTSPDAELWRTIERYFDMPAGTLTDLAAGRGVDDLSQLRAGMESLLLRFEALETEVAALRDALQRRPGGPGRKRASG